MSPLSSRQYIKRVWRVPKDRGAPEYLAALVVKSLVKHGWPVKAYIFTKEDYCEGFQILHHKTPDNEQDGAWFTYGADLQAAVEIAIRIAVRTYRVDVSVANGNVAFLKEYRVTSGGFFKEVPL